MPAPKFSIGLDYGTSSVRALIVDTADGREVGTGVWEYRHGRDGVIEDPRDPNLARQHPQDYIDGLYGSIAGALEQSNTDPAFSADRIVGIGVDTTGSTPIPIGAGGSPLALDPDFEGNLAALAWLWKDHTSVDEAEEITSLAREMRRPYLDPIGGRYSSEWFWAKILHCARVAPEVFAAAHTWLELCDWIPSYLTGSTVRSVCAAGHKGLFRSEWGGLPDEAFLHALDPRLTSLRVRLYDEAFPSDVVAGHLKADVAQGLRLPPGIPVAVGALDAHMGAVGSGVKAGTLVKIMGTSTCDIMVGTPGEEVPMIPGVCGVVKGSVLPGAYGIEAGQSAVGDLFNWFVRFSCSTHEELTAVAEKLKPGESGVLALDWNNGNRSVLVDARLTGVIVGQTLGTTSAEVYRALIESTAFGALAIIDRIEQSGVRIEEVVNCGGIAEKNDLVMQIYADVINRPMKFSRSAQAPALGAAICGSVVGGAHRTIETAQEAMTRRSERSFQPIQSNVAVYAKLKALYMQLHDAFGGVRQGELASIMKELLTIRDGARGI